MAEYRGPGVQLTVPNFGSVRLSGLDSIGSVQLSGLDSMMGSIRWARFGLDCFTC